MKLFLRTKRSVQMTAAGSVLLREAGEILRRSGEAHAPGPARCPGRSGFAAHRLSRPGHVHDPAGPRAGVSPKISDVEVQLQHMNPDEQLAAFDEGRIDLGLSRPLPPERRPFFNERRIYRDDLMVVLPRNHPLARQKKIRLEQLAADPSCNFTAPGPGPSSMTS
ncbi:MAG: LysR substrate-binding domain-containing protein [Verrucomicrobiota bacterium]